MASGSYVVPGFGVAVCVGGCKNTGQPGHDELKQHQSAPPGQTRSRRSGECQPGAGVECRTIPVCRRAQWLVRPRRRASTRATRTTRIRTRTSSLRRRITTTTRRKKLLRSTHPIRRRRCQTYQQPPCPGDGYIWTPGYWGYQSGQGYYWVPGAWTMAPYAGALWTPGWWGSTNERYGWHPGYWGRHVGYYGGIAYGNGYDGFGYQGGYWKGGHFEVNRYDNSVNTSAVHYQYNYRVKRYNTSRVSYQRWATRTPGAATAGGGGSSSRTAQPAHDCTGAACPTGADGPPEFRERESWTATNAGRKPPFGSRPQCAGATAGAVLSSAISRLETCRGRRGRDLPRNRRRCRITVGPERMTPRLENQQLPQRQQGAQPPQVPYHDVGPERMVPPLQGQKAPAARGGPVRAPGSPQAQPRQPEQRPAPQQRPAPHQRQPEQRSQPKRPQQERSRG